MTLRPDVTSPLPLPALPPRSARPAGLPAGQPPEIPPAGPWQAARAGLAAPHPPRPADAPAPRPGSQEAPLPRRRASPPGALRRLGLAGLLALATAAAGAAPGEPDPMLRMLVEKGVIPPGSLPPAATGAPPRATGWVPAVSDWASDLVLNAMHFLGVRYQRGGTSEGTGFDCSGFTRHVFESTLGLVLPRRSADQARAAGWLDVDREELKPGDLVFFNTMRSAFSHVGIYIGDDKFIHAPNRGDKVRVEDMRLAYWVTRYNGARRAPVAAAPEAASTATASTPVLPPARP